MPDARVQAAIDHWAPRFMTNGRRLQRLPDHDGGHRALGGVARRVARDRRRARRARARGARRAARRAPRARRGCARRVCLPLREVRLGARRRARPRGRRERAVEALVRRARAASTRPPSGSRRRSTAARCRRQPAPARATSTRPPLVLLIPGLDSTKEEFFHWEDVFLARGMATLSLDGPGQGETGSRSHIRPDYEAAVGAALDALGAARRRRPRPRRRGRRQSLGGYYAPRAAAFEPRIQAVGRHQRRRTTSARCWDDLPRLTRETFQHHTGAASDGGGARERARGAEPRRRRRAHRPAVPRRSPAGTTG